MSQLNTCMFVKSKYVQNIYSTCSRGPEALKEGNWTWHQSMRPKARVEIGGDRPISEKGVVSG